MKPVSRRRLIASSAASLAFSGFGTTAWAQSYPRRPVKIVVGFPPGSTADMMGRLIAQKLSERLGQNFIVENKPGASGSIAAQSVVSSAPDGYTLLLIASNNPINSAIYKDLGYDFARDIIPVAPIMVTYGVMVTNPAVPVTTVKEFIAYAKANPGKLNLASGGEGSIQHMFGALFMLMTGLEMVHVPYKGSPPALIDVMSGQVQVMFDNIPSSLQYIRSGSLRPLGVTSAKPVEVLPSVPPLGEVVTGYEASLWQGIGAPKNTPSEIIAVLNQEIRAAVDQPDLKAQISNLGAVPSSSPQKDYLSFVQEETDKWRKVVEFAGVKPQ